MKKKILIVSSIVFVLLIIGISLFLILNDNEKDKPQEEKKEILNKEEKKEDETLIIKPTEDDEKIEINNNKPNNNDNNIEDEKNNNVNTDDKVIINNNSNNTTNKNDNNIITVKPNANNSAKKYTCPDDYTLEGTMCYKYEKPRIEYECPLGSKKVEAFCIINTSTLANVNYACEDGFSSSGDTCYKEKIVNSYNPANYTNYSESSKRKIYNTFQNSCSNGIIKNENGIYNCYMIETKYASATYSCPPNSGELAGNKCISAKIEEAFTKYHCDEGYFDAIKKICTLSQNAKEK